MGTEAIAQRNAKSYEIQRGEIHHQIAVRQKHITVGKRLKETSTNSSTHLRESHIETSQNKITTTIGWTEEIPEAVPPKVHIDVICSVCAD